ncbi:CYR1_2 [Sanghuangporus weigelae]
MIIARKLRNLAVTGGPAGSTIVGVKYLSRRSPAIYQKVMAGSPAGVVGYQALAQLSVLPLEVIPPIGHVALAFTDIRSSTHLLDKNAGMPAAIRLHNQLLRRQLRLCVQLDLLRDPWPSEILESQDGKEIYDRNERLIERGLSVRMGIHCGRPVCSMNSVTHRMDYHGPMVNRSARIAGEDTLAGAEQRIRPVGPRAKVLVTKVEGIGVEIDPVGERRLKGFEDPEMLSLIYPKELSGRSEPILAEEPEASGSRVQLSVVQTRELAVLCVRLEALTSSRVLRPLPWEGNPACSVAVEYSSSVSLSTGPRENIKNNVVMYPETMMLFTSINNKAEDRELMATLDLLTVRIENTSSLHRLRGVADALQSVPIRLQ